jgi:TonB family protein
MFEIPHPGQYFFNTPDIQPIALNPQKNCLAEGIQQAADDMGWESNETESEKPTEASKPIAKTKASDRQTMTTSPDDSLYSLDPPRSVIPRMSHPRVQPEAVPIPIPMSPTKAPDWNGYINAITPKMMAWHPPEIAESSSVTVTMQIAKDGTLLRSEVKTPSGNPQIDDAAMQAVQVASPFPPLPAGYQQDSASIDYRFDYFGSAPKSRKKR